MGFGDALQGERPLPARAAFRSDIDGLRAIAVVAVVFFMGTRHSLPADWSASTSSSSSLAS